MSFILIRQSNAILYRLWNYTVCLFFSNSIFTFFLNITISQTYSFLIICSSFSSLFCLKVVSAIPASNFYLSLFLTLQILIFKLQRFKSSYKNLKIPMNTKSLLACLLIIALAASAVQGLMIKKTQNHKAARHMAKQFATGLSHNMFLAFHAQTQDDGPSGKQSEEMDAFLIEFTNFALGDGEIFGSLIGGKPLSPEAAQRVKDFVKKNENFTKEMLKMFQDPSNPECVTNLSDDQQRKIIGIIVDNMDFLALLNGTSSPDSGIDDATISNIEDAIKNDQDLGDDVAQCYDENKDSLKSMP